MPLPPWLAPSEAILYGATILLAITLALSLWRPRLLRGPVDRLLGRLADAPGTVELFIRGLFVPGNEFFTRTPEYPPGTGGGETVRKWSGVPEVHSAGDLRASADILRLLLSVNPGLVPVFKSGDASRLGWTEDAFVIGLHHRALQILDTCEPKLVAFRHPDAYRSLISPEVFQAKPGIEYGLIFKGRHPVSRRAFWVIMGIGDLGTEAAAQFLRARAGVLGRLLGNAPFAAIVAVSGGAGPERAELRWLQPKPPWWRRLVFRRLWQGLLPAPAQPSG